MTRKIFTPRPYQISAQLFAGARHSCNLHLDMGLGKTPSTLSLLNTEFTFGLQQKPALVLAPKRVAKLTWPEEAKKWDHLSHIEVCPILGTREQRFEALKNTNASVFTINYENVPWLIETLNGKWPFGRVIADESTRLKNLRMSVQSHWKTGTLYIAGQGGERSAALARTIFQHGSNGWVNLTGTPCANGLVDLWGSQWFVDFGAALGRSFSDFEENFFVKGHDGYSLRPRENAAFEIAQRMKPSTLSIIASDYFDVKKPVESFVEVELPAKARSAYDKLEKEFFTHYDGTNILASTSAVMLMKCLQVASGAIYKNTDERAVEGVDNGEWVEIHDAKLDALQSIVHETNGAPLLVAYHWKHDAERILKAFPKARLFDDSEKTFREWNAGKISMLLAHPGSMSHGLNMQDGGHHIVYFSHWWDAEQRAQILERIGPMRQIQSGYNRLVYVYHIVARDTVDSRVIGRDAEKGAGQAAFRRMLAPRP